MKPRSFFSFLAATVLVLLLIGIVGLFWLRSHNPLTLLQGGKLSHPEAAILIPKQSPMVASLLVNPDRLEQLPLVLAAPGERRHLRSEIRQLRQRLLGSTGLDYQQEIQPWLGSEVTLAITTWDVDRNPDNGQQPGYLLAVATQDPQKAREFLQIFWQKQAIAGQDLIFEQYQGVKLIHAQAPVDVLANPKVKQRQPQPPNPIPPTTLTTAVVGDRFVLFANYPKVAKDAINNVQAPDLNLATATNYQQAVKSLPQGQIGWVFLNLPQLGTWTGASQLQNPDTPEPLYDSLAIALGLHPQGLLAEIAFLGAPGQTLAATVPSLSQPVEALQYLPGGSLLTLSGTNLNNLWTQLTASVSGYPALASLLQQSLTNVQQQWGLDLPETIFSWVTDEYALGLLPTSTQPDWIFVTQRSPAATSAIAHLDEIARDQGYGTSPLNLQGQQVSAWTKLTAAPPVAAEKTANLQLQAQVQGVHATLGKYEIFATSVEAMRAAIHRATSGSLLTTAPFQQAIAPLPTPNNGYVYLDWQGSQSFLERSFPLFQWVKIIGTPMLDHLRTVSLNSTRSEAGVHRGSLFLRLVN
ncbi:hypothetical protein DO97_15550 [Neosynechococcus sphagnicola sy1]|uniref:DUF3352 domain-containing protein n=1 Tax=Neosynechococcus sphagnicola sy1 TaxID=1497020 RepID=A0A098TIE4_9CYAN|nr:DUF3352 domain-containing protein [Neosynechococcus sphagnicola]KGF71796.1 hypothetical protein DO97_15550 [Neosynechococcus sphagnicola sy1]